MESNTTPSSAMKLDDYLSIKEDGEWVKHFPEEGTKFTPVLIKDEHLAENKRITLLFSFTVTKKDGSELSEEEQESLPGTPMSKEKLEKLVPFHRELDEAVEAWLDENIKWWALWERHGWLMFKNPNDAIKYRLMWG